MPKSKVLARIEKEDDRVDEYEYDPGNDCGEHWLHLHWPYVTEDGDGSIHEYTVREVLEKLQTIYIPKEHVQKTD